MNNDPYYNWDNIRKIEDILCDRAEEFLSLLGVEYYDCGKYLAGPCPVHGGDNRTAFNFFIDGDTAKCNWVCYTHHCERSPKQGGFGKSAVGLVRGIKKLEYKEAVDFVCNFLGISINDIRVDSSEKFKNSVFKQNKILQKQRKEIVGKITRETVRSKLIIPSQYYISRRYNKDILDKYDVGLCVDETKEMYGRVVVPIYDDNYEYVVGVAGRSIFEIHTCGMYHNPKNKCPKEQDINFSKWKNNSGFNKSNFLYNYWFAKDNILKDGYAILVEGPGDVWNLEFNGIKNSLAIFGTELSDEQMLILEQSGAMTLIVMMDNDEAGKIASLNIKSKCEKLFRLYFPKFIGKDAGELTSTSITKDIEPIIKGIIK